MGLQQPYFSMIFRTIKSSIDDTRQTLGLFNKDWNTFKSNFVNAKRKNIKNPLDKYETINLNGGGFKEGISSIFRSKDLNGLKEYNRLVESGLSPMKAYSQTMKGCSEEARKNAVAMAKGKITYEEATKSLGSMGAGAKAAALGLKALSIAGNMIAMWAISEVITRTVSAINDYANSAEIAREKVQCQVIDVLLFNSVLLVYYIYLERM